MEKEVDMLSEGRGLKPHTSQNLKYSDPPTSCRNDIRRE
jgi:hypothetical protein